MKKLGRIFSAYRYFCKIGIISTLRINLKCFKFKDAIKFPILIFKGTELHIGDYAKFHISPPISTGIIWIGAFDISWLPRCASNYISIDGKITIKGKVRISYSSHIVIGKNAELIFEGENYINHNTTLLVHDKIALGYGSRVGWHSQLCDSAFHYVDVNGKVTRKTKPITIGREAWVSSFCNVGRGSYLPDHSILSTCSLLNKDYSDSGTNLLIGGIPAKIIKSGVSRIMESTNPQLCEKIDNFFINNPIIDSLYFKDLDYEHS